MLCRCLEASSRQSAQLVLNEVDARDFDSPSACQLDERFEGCNSFLVGLTRHHSVHLQALKGDLFVYCIGLEPLNQLSSDSIGLLKT